MKNKNIKIMAVMIALAVLIVSCTLQEPDLKKSADRPLSSGAADFSQYVALGNSLTAGYQSAALTEKHQKMSYVKLIADQMNKVEQTGFFQPLLGYPGSGPYNEVGGGIIVLTGFDASGNPILQPAPLGSFNPMNPYLTPGIRAHADPYHNLGIPNIVLADMDSAITAIDSYSHSPFIDLILRNPNLGNTNPIKQALMLSPTFITCWIGNNDVLGYATSGGVDPSAPTSEIAFAGLYNAMMTKLKSGGANVAVANIPDVTSVPFFTTIEFEQEVQPGVVVPVYIQTDGGNRYATIDDLILLTAKNVLGDVSGKYEYPVGAPIGFHPDAPLPSQFVLDKAEVEVAQTAVAAFNAIISAASESFNAPLADVNALLKEASTGHGLAIAGITLSSAFISGGLFSYDGVRPSDIGHAVIANEFIMAINESFNAYIPPIDILEFIKDTQPIEVPSSMGIQMPSLNGVVEIMGGHID